MATSYEKQRKAREKAAKKEEKQRLKDEKTAQKTSNVRKLGAIAENSTSAAAKVSAIARLKSRGAQAALLSLAENSSQAPVRCEAAWLLEDQEKAREILSGSIAEAFGDSRMTKDYHFREWTDFVPNDTQLLKAYRSLKDSSIAQALWPVFARKRSAVLREILAEAVMWFPTVEEILKIYTGSREDWRYLAEHNKNTGTTARAVNHLSLEDADVLTRIADKGVKGRVDVSELMGATVHIHLNLLGKDVIVIVPTEGKVASFPMGSELLLGFDGSVAHIFSKDSEKNLEW